MPPMKPEPLSGQGRAPSVKRFNRKMLALIAIVAAIVITFAFAIGLQHPKSKAPASADRASRTPTPNDAVNQLPSNYSEVVPVLGEPRPGDLGNSSRQRPLTPAPSQQLAHNTNFHLWSNYTQQIEIERLREEDAARSAGVAFTSAGAGDDATSHVAGDVTQDLQQKLLDLAQRSNPSTPSSVPARLSRRDRSKTARKPRISLPKSRVVGT